MAIRRLINMLGPVAQGLQRSIRNDQLTLVRNLNAQRTQDQAFIDRARVVQVYGVSGAAILVGGNVVFADQATDEPFQTGQSVYVSKVANGGHVIHGSVK